MWTVIAELMTGPLNRLGQCSDPQLVPRPQEPKRDILYTIILYRTAFSRSLDDLYPLV